MRYKNYILLLAITLFCNKIIIAQTKDSAFSYSAYAEMYFAYDANKPNDNTRPAFVYSHNKSQQIDVNLALIKASYQKKNVRANIAVAAGTYMKANYAAESGLAKNIFEANIGVQLSAKNNIWMDAGILPSHIGFESAIGADCWNITRSMMADNSPYFETGAKISYKNNKMLLAFVVLNGWQRIKRPEGNKSIAFGHQLTFSPNKKVSINSSSFIGNDKPDSAKQLRFFHNLYSILQLSNAWSVILGFDIGAEQKFKQSNQYNVWFTTVAMAKFSKLQHTLSTRVEQYKDANGVIIKTNAAQAFNVWGFTVNYDYQWNAHIISRVEFKTLQSVNNSSILYNSATTNMANSLTAAIIVKL